MTDILNQLADIINERASKSPDVSYVAKLLHKGRNKIAQKTGEEAVETVIAALQEGKKELISESADLLFHLSVLWHDCGVLPQDVTQELEKRIGISGLDEKAAREAT